MKLTIAIIAMAVMTSCTSSASNTRSLFDRLEFEDGEYGSFELEGTVDVNPIPLMSTNVHMKLEKHKDKPETAAN